jgi:hypothetical protein
LFGLDIDEIVDLGCGSAFTSISAGFGVVDHDGNPALYQITVRRVI